MDERTTMNLCQAEVSEFVENSHLITEIKGELKRVPASAFSSQALAGTRIPSELLATEYADIREYILACAVDYILADGSSLATAIDRIGSGHVLAEIGDKVLFGGKSKGLLVGDFIYYDMKEGAFRLVRQVNADYEMIGTYVVYNSNSELFDAKDSVFDAVVLPFSVGFLRQLIRLGNVTGHIITYSDCGAYLDGIHDDRPYVEACHRIANLFGLAVASNHGKISIANCRKIMVETDVDLSGSELDITDYNWDIMYQIYNEPVDISISDPTMLTQNVTYVAEWDDEKYPPMTAVLLSNPKGVQTREPGRSNLGKARGAGTDRE